MPRWKRTWTSSECKSGGRHLQHFLVLALLLLLWGWLLLLLLWGWLWLLPQQLSALLLCLLLLLVLLVRLLLILQRAAVAVW
jgi:hypothetical protein